MYIESVNYLPANSIARTEKNTCRNIVTIVDKVTTV